MDSGHEDAEPTKEEQQVNRQVEILGDRRDSQVRENRHIVSRIPTKGIVIQQYGKRGDEAEQVNFGNSGCGHEPSSLKGFADTRNLADYTMQSFQRETTLMEKRFNSWPLPSSRFCFYLKGF